MHRNISYKIIIFENATYILYRLSFQTFFTCCIQQTTSQCCDNTWFPRIMCTLYNHHLHHRGEELGRHFWFLILFLFGRGFPEQGNVVRRSRCILLISNLARSFKPFLLLRLRIIYTKKARRSSHYLDPNLPEHNLKLGTCQKKVKIQLML